MSSPWKSPGYSSQNEGNNPPQYSSMTYPYPTQPLYHRPYHHYPPSYPPDPHYTATRPHHTSSPHHSSAPAHERTSLEAKIESLEKSLEEERRNNVKLKKEIEHQEKRLKAEHLSEVTEMLQSHANEKKRLLAKQEAELREEYLVEITEINLRNSNMKNPAEAKLRENPKVLKLRGRAIDKKFNKHTVKNADPLSSKEVLDERTHYENQLSQERDKFRKEVTQLRKKIADLKEQHVAAAIDIRLKAADKLRKEKAKLIEKYNRDKKKCAGADRKPGKKRKATWNLDESGESEKNGHIFKIWMKHIEELKKFRALHGHCNVPPSYKFNEDGTVDEDKRRLHNFIVSQRSHYKKMCNGHHDHSLTPEKIQLLNSVGFEWSLKSEPLSWDVRYEQLKEYLAENGHCNTPQYYNKKGCEGLGQWSLTQRRFYREGKISAEKIAKLEELGFVWSLRDRGGTLSERMASYASKAKKTATGDFSKPDELPQATEPNQGTQSARVMQPTEIIDLRNSSDLEERY